MLFHSNAFLQLHYKMKKTMEKHNIETLKWSLTRYGVITERASSYKGVTIVLGVFLQIIMTLVTTKII